MLTSICSPGPTPADEPGWAHVMAKLWSSSATAIRTTGAGIRRERDLVGDPPARPDPLCELRSAVPLGAPSMARSHCFSSNQLLGLGERHPAEAPPGQVSLRSRKLMQPVLGKDGRPPPIACTLSPNPHSSEPSKEGRSGHRNVKADRRCFLVQGSIFHTTPALAGTPTADVAKGSHWILISWAVCPWPPAPDRPWGGLGREHYAS